jgi:hypothetical protein
MGGALPLHAARRRDEDEPVSIIRPEGDLLPLWGQVDQEADTVSAGELTHHIEQAAR